jgi:hypothetical protein
MNRMELGNNKGRRGGLHETWLAVRSEWCERGKTNQRGQKSFVSSTSRVGAVTKELTKKYPK